MNVSLPISCAIVEKLTVLVDGKSIDIPNYAGWFMTNHQQGHLRLIDTFWADPIAVEFTGAQFSFILRVRHEERRSSLVRP